MHLNFFFSFQEILGVREYISSLNGNVAKMMALLIVNFAELTILGTFFQSFLTAQLKYLLGLFLKNVVLYYVK